MNKLVLVLGMHRSGTSLLTQIISKLGVYIGEEDELGEADPSNEDGHFEFTKIKEIHDELLSHFGMKWDCTCIDRIKTDAHEVENFKSRISAELDYLFSNHDTVAIKDPRSSYFLGIWDALLKEKGIEPRYIYVIRKPNEVSASLHKRDGILENYGRRLWKTYNVMIQRFLLGRQSLTIYFDDLFQATIADVLSDYIFGKKADVDIGGIAKERLRHNNCEAATLDIDMDSLYRRTASAEELMKMCNGILAWEEEQPLVSVIMPAYNAELYIEEAISSILAQSYKNIELIIVDDYSQDNTPNVIKNFDDDRIRYIRNDKNRGIAYSTNYGIEQAKGKYIALMDDDDVAFPGRIMFQTLFLEKHEEIDVLGGRSIDIDQNGNEIGRFDVPHYNPDYVRAMLLIQCVDFRNGTTMMRRSFIDRHELRYTEGQLGMQDYLFFVEASKVGNISSIPEFLIKWRSHGNNETLKQMRGNRDNRRKKYKEIQKRSLELSGFYLESDEIDFLSKVYSEERDGCSSFSEWERLVEITKKILSRATEMNIVYTQELEHYLKKRLCEELMRVKYS